VTTHRRLENSASTGRAVSDDFGVYPLPEVKGGQAEDRLRGHSREARSENVAIKAASRRKHESIALAAANVTPPSGLSRIQKCRECLIWHRWHRCYDLTSPSDRGSPTRQRAFPSRSCPTATGYPTEPGSSRPRSSVVYTTSTGSKSQPEKRSGPTINQPAPSLAPEVCPDRSVKGRRRRSSPRRDSMPPTAPRRTRSEFARKANPATRSRPG
jgi:hypothetical protein